MAGCLWSMWMMLRVVLVLGVAVNVWLQVVDELMLTDFPVALKARTKGER